MTKELFECAVYLKEQRLEFVQVLHEPNATKEEISALVDNEARKRQAIEDIKEERRYQDKKWGGSDHDDTETEDSWQKYITEYANAQGRSQSYDFRKRMVKVAALALAAIESHDRKQT